MSIKKLEKILKQMEDQIENNKPFPGKSQKITCVFMDPCAVYERLRTCRHDFALYVMNTNCFFLFLAFFLLLIFIDFKKIRRNRKLIISNFSAQIINTFFFVKKLIGFLCIFLL